MTFRSLAGSGMGTIEVVTGSMFSGKTEELIRRVKRALLARQQVQAFKPRIDDRYDKHAIVSHSAAIEGSGRTIEAIAVGSSESLEARVEEETQVVAIDEAQFFDRGIIDVAQRLADRGMRVIVARAHGDRRRRDESARRLHRLRRRGEPLSATHLRLGDGPRRRQRVLRGALPRLLRATRDREEGRRGLSAPQFRGVFAAIGSVTPFRPLSAKYTRSMSEATWVPFTRQSPRLATSTLTATSGASLGAKPTHQVKR